MADQWVISERNSFLNGRLYHKGVPFILPEGLKPAKAMRLIDGPDAVARPPVPTEADTMSARAKQSAADNKPKAAA